MPLSEYEQRVLHQMEQQLRTDDPRFVSSLASESHYSVRRVTIGVLLVLAGLGLLVGGVASSLVWLGVLGFLAMLGGVMLMISRPRTVKKQAGDQRPASTPAAARAGRGSRGSRAGFMQRLEDRWDRRRDTRGR